MASLNAGPEYYVAEEKYRNALGDEEKLAALQEMLKHCPKHKSAHTILAEIKTKIARLRKEMTRMAVAKASKKGGGDFIRKQGAAQVVLVGLPNSGKTALLNAVTNAKLLSTDSPFETTRVKPAMMEHERIQVQILDTPSIHAGNKRITYALARPADLVLVLFDGFTDLKKQEEFFKDLRNPRVLFVLALKHGVKKAPGFYCCDLLDTHQVNALKNKIIEALGVLRVYTKSQRGKPDYDRPIVLFKGKNTVLDAAKEIHKDFLNFEKARVWGSTKFPGQLVGPEYELKDEDVLELSLK
ncbi:MAG: GTPase [Candidatus Micrarchaeota archaeon]